MANTPYSLAPAPLGDKPLEAGGFFAAVWQKWFLALMDTYLYTWDDLRFASQGINPPGAASDPTRSTTTGLLNFSGAQDNVIAGVANLPHEWAAGTTVRPHLHLRFTTSANANTRWKFEYDIANPEGSFTNNSGTYTTLATITVANPQNVKKHVLAEFGDLSMAGFRESTAIVWRISRLANTDVLDNDVSACELLEFDIHYQRGKRGTVQEYPS